MKELPKHNCRNCGECCGPVPVSEQEQVHIQKYVDSHEVETNILATSLQCKFRVNNKCSIYAVRPMICRLMGVTAGMECQYGNSAEINGYPYLTKDMIGLLNDVISIK